ncbi:AI-2E family transporter [Arthrobacter ginkgonis]
MSEVPPPPTPETNAPMPRGWKVPTFMRTAPAWPLSTGFTMAAGALLAIALALAMLSISTVLMSIALAAFLALSMDPAVRAVSRRGVSHFWSVAIVAGAFLAVVAAILAFIVPATARQFSYLVQNAPEAVENLPNSAWLSSVEQATGLDVSAVLLQALESVTTPESMLAISGGVLRAGVSVVGAVSSAFIVVVLTLYFVSSLGAIKRAAAALVPAYRRARFSAVLEEITTSVGGAVAGGVTLSMINAAVVFVLQLLIGSSVPVLMALAAFFITLVPMIGSVIFLVVGTVGALFIGPTAALVFAITYFVYIQIEAYQITPKVMGHAVDVPGVLIIIGAMTGAALLGLMGALLAIPVTASILIIIRQITVPRRDAQVHPPPK